MERILQHKLIILTIAIQLTALPLVLFAVKENQDTRTQASASTTLSFSPSSTSSTPHSVNIGQEFPVDIVLTPNENLISLAKLEINYDPSRITLSETNPVVVNSIAFPQIVEGPVYTNGKIQLVVSIGFDRTRVIQTETKVLTVKFKATGTTNQSQVTFGANSGLYSLGTGDSSNLSVLSATTPMYIKVNDAPTPTFTPVLTNTPTPSPKPTVTPAFTPSPTAIPTNTSTPTLPPTNENTTLLLNGLKLHGLGKGGDSPNPNSNGTLNPLRNTRDLTVEIYDINGILINSVTGYIKYTVSTQGEFNGTATLPNSIESGDYLIKIQTPYYLRKQLQGFMNIVKGQANTARTAETTALIAGDINRDNKLSVLDFDIIMECYSDIQPAKSCDATKKLAADISDDGKVNQDDYNLFLRELSIQEGE